MKNGEKVMKMLKVISRVGAGGKNVVKKDKKERKTLEKIIHEVGDCGQEEVDDCRVKEEAVSSKEIMTEERKWWQA